MLRGRDTAQHLLKSEKRRIRNINDWTKWALGVVAILFCAAIVAIWNSIAGKANKADIERELSEVRSDNKARDDEVNKKFDMSQAEGLRQYRELQTAIELVKNEIRVLDKHSLTSNDLIEIKADIKELIKGIAETVKLIDGMPERLSSLEATRNKQSER